MEVEMGVTVALGDRSQVLRVNPIAHVALRQDHRARIGEDAIAREVVGMMVGVDDERDGQLRQLTDLRKQLRGLRPLAP